MEELTILALRQRLIQTAIENDDAVRLEAAMRISDTHLMEALAKLKDVEDGNG